MERWFERLPMYLLEEPKRQKVLKPESCNFPNSEPGHRASGKRLPEKLVLSHSSIAVLRPRFSLCDEGILQEHKGRTSAQSEFFGCGTKALTARI